MLHIREGLAHVWGEDDVMKDDTFSSTSKSTSSRMDYQAISIVKTPVYELSLHYLDLFFLRSPQLLVGLVP